MARIAEGATGYLYHRDVTPPASDLASRRVLVTGAAGFIGSHLVEQLAAIGARVRAFVRYESRGSRGWLDHIPSDVADEIEFFAGDIRDGSTVDRALADCEVVLHLASLIAIPYSYDAPEAYVATNIVGALNVLNACRRHDVGRLVLTSTSEVYGNAQRVPITEDQPLHPQSPYAASKAAADQLALSYWASFGTPVVVLRPFNTYGPRQSLRAVIPTIAAQLLAGGPVHLGADHPTRDFTFVSDTVRGFISAALAPGVEGETIHLGTGTEISIRKLAQMIADLVGAPLVLARDDQRVRPPRSEIDRLVSDPSRAQRQLGWTAGVGLSDGLTRTVEWMRSEHHIHRPAEYIV
jgi:NAD dependent epimerase/dehydratase